MLVMAAAGPALLNGRSFGRWWSCWMIPIRCWPGSDGDGADSPRTRAAAAVERGIGAATTTWPDSSWPAPSRVCWASRCERPSAPASFWPSGPAKPLGRPGRAIALAAEVGGPTARILVLSDHAPTMTSGRRPGAVVGVRRQAAQHGLHGGHPHPVRRQRAGAVGGGQLSDSPGADHVDPRRRQPRLAAAEHGGTGRRGRPAVLLQSAGRFAAAAGTLERRRPGHRQPVSAAARVDQAGAGAGRPGRSESAAGGAAGRGGHRPDLEVSERPS